MKRNLGMSIVVLLAVGCNGTTKVQLKSEVGANGGGTIYYRIYQLKDPKAFEEADFEAIWSDAGAALKLEGEWKSKVLLDKFDLFPPKQGEKSEPFPKPFPEERFLPDATHIGVAALFAPEKSVKEERDAKWKKTIPLKKVGDKIFVFKGFEIEIIDD